MSCFTVLVQVQLVNKFYDVIVSGGFVPSHGQSGRLLAFKFASKNPHHAMSVWPRTLSFICIFTSLGAVPYQTLKVLTNKVSYK